MTVPAPGAARVAFAGENPLIMLYRPGDDDLVAVPSLWHARYTEHGSGTSLLIWADPDSTGLTDSTGDATGENGPNRYLHRQPATGSAPVEGVQPTMGPAARPRVGAHRAAAGPVRPGARCSAAPDHLHRTTCTGPPAPDHLHRTTCTTGTRLIELQWRNPGRAIWTETFPYEYRTTAVIVPCPDAAILVDGQPAIGEVRPHHDEFVSSAVLAFCETWMTRPELT